MKVSKASMQLYVVTDRTWLQENTLANVLDKIIPAGVTFVQLREKELDFDSFVSQAKAIKKVTDYHHIPFVINDNIDIALAVDADGIHVGQTDLSLKECRTILGEDKIIGVSAQTVAQALKAQEEGADYIGVGAVFSTTTKQDADAVSFKTLQEICHSVHIPVVAIGGINQQNILALQNSGINGVAIISAILGAKNPYKATQELAVLSKQITSCKTEKATPE